MKTIFKLIINSGPFILLLGVVFWILYLISFAINKGQNLGEYEYLLTLAKYCRDTGITVLIISATISVLGDVGTELQEKREEEKPNSRRR